MRLLLIISLLTTSIISFAHRGEFLAINNVEITETEKTFIYSFHVENINMMEVRDIKIEFVINSKSVFQKYYPVLTNDAKFYKEHFEIPKIHLNPEDDFVQIEITEIFGKKDDWGGWDSPNMLKQVNTLASEFYVEAPWRMKKTDDAGNEKDIPLHFFLHDADLVVGFTIKIDYINIRLKNASSGTFGPVLTYDNIPDADYRNMFSCLSQADATMSIKGFDINAFSPASNKTIVFDAESDWLDEYVSVDDTYWFFTFNIPASELAGMEDVVDVTIEIGYANLTITDETFGVRIFRSDEDLPEQMHYYRGDTHLHSMYTQNDAEIGLPLCATKEAAKLIGLDWITTTDHTSDFDNYGDGNIQNNWARIQAESAQLNSDDPSLIYIPGQEVAANNNEGKLVHMLAYPNYNDPFGLPFLGDGDGDISSTGVTVDNALSQLHGIDGFAFSAHPYATEDKLPLVPVDGGIWNLGHNGFAVNGDNFPETGGNIICNDPNAASDILSPQNDKLVKDGLKGSQIWNHRGALTISGTSGDEFDAWGVNGGINPLSQADTASFSFHFQKFRQGQEIVNFINQTGLSLKNQDSTYKNWKMYYSAGADAHGSFNFSNTGNFAGFGSIDDNAVGKLSTLVYCPNGMGANGEEVLKGMYNGRMSLSDGPILTMGISDDGNDGTNEIYMGDDEVVNTLTLDNYFLNFNYTTTAEYGDVTKFTLVVGTETGEVRKNLTLTNLSGDQQISYDLTDVLDSLLGAGNTPLDEYIYVRAELQTFRDFSANTNVFRTDHSYYYSFTNPIWIKFSEVDLVDVNDLALEVFPNPFLDDFTLRVKNPGQNDVVVNLYNDLGQLILTESHHVDEYKDIQYSATELGISTGVYTFRATVGEQSVSLKVVHN